METIFYYAPIIGGALLSATLIALAVYTFRISQYQKSLLFLLSGLVISIILIYGIILEK